MSTDQQDQSIPQQLEFIARYAAATGCAVLRIYRDEGKSGLTLNQRQGLQQLLSDVENGCPGFDVLLVYDVTRWGRFQDVDESAYYEFLCRRRGVRVVYCAEHFSPEEAPLTHLMKDVKRLMAAEYSRQLSVKVFDAQVHLLQQGFKQGGAAGYGLRRVCIRADGSVRRVLDDGERKAHPSDRVIFAPGPELEVATVRLIFRLYNEQHMSFRGLARALNADSVSDERGEMWSETRIRAVLTNPKYCGTLMYNRTSSKLGSNRRKNDSAEWITCREAHQPIVSPREFEQARLNYRIRRGLEPDAVLERLREIYRRDGHLTYRLIDAEPGLPRVALIKKMFGGLHKAYALVMPVRSESSTSHVSQAERQEFLRVMRGQVFALVALTEHRVAATSNPYILCLDGVFTLRLSIVSCCRRSGCWGWRVPAGSAGSDFVLSGLVRVPGIGVDSYVLLSTGAQDSAYKWANVERIDAFGGLVSKSLEQIFGLSAR